MNLVRTALCLSLLTLVSGCFSTTIRNGRPAAPATVAYDARWHHGAIAGMAEISGPYDLSEICPQGWAEIQTQTSFLNWVASWVSLYTPQTIAVRCATDGSSPGAAAQSTAPVATAQPSSAATPTAHPVPPAQSNAGAAPPVAQPQALQPAAQHAPQDAPAQAPQPTPASTSGAATAPQPGTDAPPATSPTPAP